MKGGRALANSKNVKFFFTDDKSKYDSLEDIVLSKKYDLIIIDGPFGYDRKYQS